MEASIIFHFASRGNASGRLALIDFAQLLDPRWNAQQEQPVVQPTTTTASSVLNEIAHSMYNFVLGGLYGNRLRLDVR